LAGWVVVCVLRLVFDEFGVVSRLFDAPERILVPFVSMFAGAPCVPVSFK
jgi:hypothetical protein